MHMLEHIYDVCYIYQSMYIWFRAKKQHCTRQQMLWAPVPTWLVLRDVDAPHKVGALGGLPLLSLNPLELLYPLLFRWLKVGLLVFETPDAFHALEFWTSPYDARKGWLLPSP